MTLLTQLTEILSNDERLVINGKLAKNKIVELALNLDPSLLKLLLSNEQLKNHFFTDVEGILIFDKVAFQRFVSNKSFLPDSFTQFKNKIGLSADNHYLTETNDIVLSWPYKDCILEGGQTKEDQKRSEIFWNETLAPEQVDTLLAPKALQNFVKYDENGEHKDFQLEENDNLIIKGNNLLTLHTLKERFRGKVKLIYIDPPYNTGSDSFGYNDKFNHSTWLTFMNNRLNVANELLSQDGSIFINIDDDEAHYLKVLADDIFGRENFVANVVWQKKYSPQSDAKWFSDMHDHILVYAKDKSIWRPNLLPRTDKQNKAYKYNDNDGKGLYRTDNVLVKSFSKTGVFAIINPNTNEQFFPPEGRCWRFNKETYGNLIANNGLYFGKDGKGAPQLKRYLNEVKQGLTPQTIWFYDEVGHTQDAKKEVNTLRLPEGFETPKPESLLMRILTLGSNVNDVVLDFFGGSGTTASTALKMKRNFVTCEQMDYVNTTTVPRLKKVVDGDLGGISEDVSWQGGGSFVYCELTELASKYSDRIELANTNEELLNIWNDLKQNSNLSYKINPQGFDKSIQDFSELSIEEQKSFLIEAIDKNQLYVNYSEIDDETNDISEQDKKYNKQFYGA
ncbi:site-specific DNA-methyltransferase [Psychromonas aquatilis]|uniref:site-specific DNA-methyltransferase (adenine-specific) n=1 Tax=Psychromonas aquatilis TaxID=2005072 RepID=A0ABU9GLA1_9GAMM